MFCAFSTTFMIYLLQQMQWHLVITILVLAVVQSSSATLAAEVLRADSFPAPTALTLAVDIVSHKLLEYDAKVWRDNIMNWFSLD